MCKRWTVLGLLGLGLAVGVAIGADDEDDDNGLTLDQIPAAAREALLELAGGAAITEVEGDKEHGVVLYEAAWAVNGGEIEAAVTADGSLVEMEQEITADDLPEAVKAVAAKHFAGAAEIEYEKVTVVVYEIEGKANGKEKEIKVLATGQIVGREKGDDAGDDDDGDDDDDDGEENEEEISLDQVPAPAKATILAEAKGAKIVEVERETKDGKTVYEAEWMENGQEVEVKVAPDGTLLKRETEAADDDEDDDDK